MSETDHDPWDDIGVVGATLEDVEKSKKLVAQLMTFARKLSDGMVEQTAVGHEVIEEIFRQRLFADSGNTPNKSVDLTDDKT